MVERLTAEAAIERIRVHRQRHELVLGVDGFVSVSGGYMASLDLILDLSTKSLSVEEAADQAEVFVTANARGDVTFEVVA